MLQVSNGDKKLQKKKKKNFSSKETVQFNVSLLTVQAARWSPKGEI